MRRFKRLGMMVLAAAGAWGAMAQSTDGGAVAVPIGTADPLPSARLDEDIAPTVLLPEDPSVLPPFAEPPPKSLKNHTLLKSGMASWYGPGFHGRLTANGERYNMHELTAAHRYLPFGTLLKVRSVHTGKTVVVRVNDRGPYKHQRILDLSRAAMDALGVLGRGVTQVEVWVQSHQLEDFQARTERFFSRHPGSAPKPAAPTKRSASRPQRP